jgi:hypothetical protein
MKEDEMDMKIEDWCQCKDWLRGEWKYCDNLSEVNFCPFCGRRLKK